MRLALIAAAIVGAGCRGPAPPPVEATPVPWSAPARAPVAYGDELAAVDAAVAAAIARAEADPTSWVDLEHAAAAVLRRARLTRSGEDRARAEDLLEQAFDRAPAGSGPFFVRAGLHRTMHRHAEAAADLDVVAAWPAGIRPEQSAMLLQRGSLARGRGDLADARRLLDASVAAAPTSGAFAALGLLYVDLGDLDAAEGSFRDALDAYDGRPAEPAAWLHLQLAELDLRRGDRAAATTRLEAADAVLGGWPVVLERLAAVQAGDPREARGR